MKVLVTGASARTYVKDGVEKSFGEIHGVACKPAGDKEFTGMKAVQYSATFEAAAICRQKLPAVYDLDVEVIEYGADKKFVKVMEAEYLGLVGSLSGTGFTVREGGSKAAAAA